MNRLLRREGELVFSKQATASGLLVVAVLFAPLLIAACSSMPKAPAVIPDTPEAAVTVDLWSRLLEQAPYPYTTPLPPAQETSVDGTYSKFNPREDTRPFCRRCMPYPAEGGIWLLHLDKGVYRILSTRSLNGWRSLGSLTVDGDQLTLFNDPHCMDAVGTYTWKLEGGQLVLKVIEDECADGWRGITFTDYPWTLEGSAAGE